MFTLLTIILILLALWTLWGFFSSRVEQAEYSVLEKKKGYEIRLYPKHIVAQTTVEGDYRTALNTGFRIVARYIFGGNEKKHSVSMTAPVVATKVSESNLTQVISFGMPRSYTLETLPTPTDSRVKLVEIPPEKYAVKKFSWLATRGRVEKFERELVLALSADHVETLGVVAYAGYDAPWTLPWMRRQEVLVQVK